MEKIIKMKIGSQVLSASGNWEIIDRYKIIGRTKQPIYRYVVKCTKCGATKDISQGHWSEENIRCENCHEKKRNGEIIGIYKILDFDHIANGHSYYKVECQKCGNIRVLSIGNMKNKKYCNKCRDATGNVAYNAFYNGYKSGAKKRNLDFMLTPPQFVTLIQSNCIYCGRAPEEHEYKLGAKREKYKFIANGIDRIDSAKGYTVDNCVSCCTQCNTMKLNYTREQFLNQVKRIYNFSLKKGSETIENLIDE